MVVALSAVFVGSQSDTDTLATCFFYFALVAAGAAGILSRLQIPAPLVGLETTDLVFGAVNLASALRGDAVVAGEVALLANAAATGFRWLASASTRFTVGVALFAISTDKFAGTL